MANEPLVPQRTVILQDKALRRLRGFTAVPNAALRHPKLSHGAKLTYGVLLSYAWQDTFCHPAQERLANDMNCSIRQVQRFLAELGRFHFIDWKQQGLTLPNVYYILPLPEAPDSKVEEDPASTTAPDATDPSYPEATPLAHPEATPVSYKEDSMKNTQNNVYVGSEPGKEASSSRLHRRRARRWQLTDEQLDEADALAHAIADGIGQSDNLRSYFVRAAEAIEAGQTDLVFEAISLTKERGRSGGIDTTPSQYFHDKLHRLRRRHNRSAKVTGHEAVTRAAREAFLSRSTFPKQT